MLLDMTSSADYRWWNLFSDIESMNSSTHTYRSYLSYDNFPTYTEEWWHKAVVNACNWITIVFGSVAFVGNIFILMVALAANEIRKKRSSYLMVNLAIKDAMLGLLFLFQGICNYAVIQGLLYCIIVYRWFCQVECRSVLTVNAVVYLYVCYDFW
ncbi:uncharacterized protein LOC117117955 isoform X2 [Anneissia japonica]|uniref:uncharacterized protein LOC117117955 isoform X2 n=1 Tax=Anneissia japonica TaxID=1529436 RepID=UPI00142586D1|nr:uncharacterized protein LOC117117955 isoform X2 [Anneissia japonica]